MYGIAEATLPKKAGNLDLPSLQAVAVAELLYIENLLDDITSLTREWRQHVVENGLNDNMEWADYWTLVNEACHPDGSKKCPNLMKVFGVIAMLQSMKVATLVGLMQARFKIKSSSSASNIKIDKNLILLVNQMSTNATDAEAMDARKKYLSTC